MRVAGTPKALVSSGSKAYEVAKSYVPSEDVRAPASRGELKETTFPILLGLVEEINI